LEVADEVYRVVMRGEGELMLGNHERKIMRWLAQTEAGRVSLRLSDGNRVTTNALNALGAPARKRWVGRFKGLCSRASYVRAMGNITFAHAGVHPEFWNGRASAREIETWALFGEFDPGGADQAPERKYAWVEAVPEGETLIVGHDIRSTMMPLSQVGAAGGRTVFLDTGSGKGGALTIADLKFTETGITIANFSRY
jgi:protein phosphatase